MPSYPGATPRARPWLLAAALLLALAGLGCVLATNSHLELPLNDFVQYWAAGRLNLAGENPYDLTQLGAWEREAGRNADVLPMYNPPWVLPLVMPFALLPSQLAYVGWMIALIAALAYAAVSLWKHYGGPANHVGAALVLTFLFVPTFLALLLAQISPLLLLGCVLFLQAERRGRHFLAGTATVLLAIKPHLFMPFWVLLLFWSIDRRRWSILAGATLAGIVLLLAAVLFNPNVIGQYAEAIATRPPAQYRSPTLGTLIRLVLGEEMFRLQFLAVVPGLLWLAVYWQHNRHRWEWSRDLPLVLFVSLLTAPYGSWPFDLVVLLVPLLQIAAQRAADFISAVRSARIIPAVRNRGTLLFVAFVVINAAAAIMVAALVNFLWFIWLTPALLVAYLLANPKECSRVREGLGAGSLASPMPLLS